VIVPLLAVAASMVVWALVYRSLVHHPLDAMALTLYYLALQLLWRPLMLATGLDTPFPTQLFDVRDTESLLLLGQAVVVLFLLSLWAGARLLSPLVRPVSVLRWSPPPESAGEAGAAEPACGADCCWADCWWAECCWEARRA